MSRWKITTALGTIVLGIVSSVGCSMSANPHDCKYAAYGGLIDRVDRVNGRVGSVIDPAEVVTHEPSEASAAEPTPAEPMPEPEPIEPSDSPEPAEAQLEDGRELIHVDQEGSMLELIETENTHDESIYR